MSAKTMRRVYWVATIALAVWMMGSGVAEILHNTAGALVFLRLGLPLYLMTIIGAGKLIGGIAILQWRWKTVKEWAFAGYAIDCVGASASHYFSHDAALSVVLPLILLGLMFIPYCLWKKTFAK